MVHKCRKLKKILSMVLSTVLIIGVAGGAIPVRVIAEEAVNTNAEEIKPAEGSEMPSGGDEILSGGEGIPTGGSETLLEGSGDGAQAGTGGVSGTGNELIPNEGETGEDQSAQDNDSEYFQVNFYSDGVLLETCEVKAGEKLSRFPELVKEGYRFSGWAIAEENGEEFDLDGAIIQTMDLYAKWEVLVEAMLLEADIMPAAAQEASYSTDGGNTWSEGTLEEALDACCSASQPAEIKLLQNITLTGDNWDAPKLLAGSSDVTIDGQGHTITRGEGAGGTSGVLLILNQACTVILKNITIDGGAIWQGDDPKERINIGCSNMYYVGMIFVNNGGVLILERGTVLQNNEVTGNKVTGLVSRGGAVTVETSGNLIMKSGAVICNNAAYQGGGIFIGGATFQMEGGEIYGNYANIGGGISSGGTFIMTDGEISGNVASYDGAGLSCAGENPTVKMSGGSISNNMTEGNGGGIRISGTNANFLMSGGNISHNVAERDGGGVEMYSTNGQMVMSGGDIDGNIANWHGGGIRVYTDKYMSTINRISVSGSPVIVGNTTNGEANNVYLAGGETISLAGAMTKGASIGVTYQTTDKEMILTSGWPVQMGEKEKPENYFVSDSSDYIVVKDDATNEAKLVNHTHTFGTDWKWDDTTHWHECDCGKKADQAAHTEDAGTITKEPTETEAGQKVYKCTVCGHERIEILSATGGGGDDSGDNQGGSGDDQSSNVENQGGSDNAAIQGIENVEKAVIIDVNTSAASQAKEENAVQKETAGGSAEPKTGENMAVEVYATIAMIAGLLYLLSYFECGKRGMTEAEKRELLTRIIQWSRKGGQVRTGLALAAIFLLLVYYHSIGKKAAGWKEIYGE